MRILLIEDDQGIASFVEKGLIEAGYVTEHVSDGQAGLDQLVHGSFDAAIVDIMLPLLDGFSLIEAARRQNVTTPVLILSAKSTVDDRVKGLQHGGDDYLVKPFEMAELLARLEVLQRRASTAAAEAQTTAATTARTLTSTPTPTNCQPWRCRRLVKKRGPASNPIE